MMWLYLASSGGGWPIGLRAISWLQRLFCASRSARACSFVWASSGPPLSSRLAKSMARETGSGA